MRPAIDCHIHCYLTTAGRGLLRGMDDADIERAAVMSLPYPGLGNFNANTFAVKALAPHRLYAFCAPDFRMVPDPDWGRRNVEYLQTCWDAGADGVKILLGKPGSTHFDFLHPRMRPMYEWLSDNQIPLVHHVGDVPHFWYPDQVDEWSTSVDCAGIYAKYPDACMSPEEIWRQTAELSRAYPDMIHILAHLAMPHDSLDWLAAIMDECPNVYTELSGSCSLGFLVREPERAHRFLSRFADRIFFGTDAILVHNETEEQFQEQYRTFAKPYRAAFETGDDIQAFFPHAFKGLDLPDAEQQAIMFDNFDRVVGKPRPQNNPAALKAVLDEARQTLTALQGVDDDNHLGVLWEQMLAKRQSDFERYGRIDESVLECKTIPSQFKALSLKDIDTLRNAVK